MKVLNLLTSGGVGGIEVLCRDIAQYSEVHNVFCFLFGEGLIYEDMKSSQYDVYSLSYGKKLSLGRFSELKRLAFDCDIVVVHHDDPFLQMHYLMLMKMFPAKKYISMVHHCYDPVADNVGYGFLKRSLKKYLIMQMFKKSNRLIFVSKNGYKSYLCDFKIDGQKVDIVYNGISTTKIELGKNCKKEYGQTIKLLYVGRLVELKGVDKLIDAFAHLAVHCELKIVGDGSMRLQLEKMVHDSDKSRVRFCGFQTDVTNYLSESEVFIYPSKTEIFGLSIVEAMAFGNICVASNVGGIPEIIDDGVNGYLNHDNSVEGLVSAINKAIDVIKDKGKRNLMQSRARATAEKFSILKTVEELEAIYVELVGM